MSHSGVSGFPETGADLWRGPGNFRGSFGNGPNTVSGSTVSNTELSEFFGTH